MTRFCYKVAKLIVCPTHLRNSMTDTSILLDNTRKVSAKCLLILSVNVKMIYIFADLPCMDRLIKLAKMVGLVHEADHAHSIQSTWLLHRLAMDVPFVACVINSTSTFVHHLDLWISFRVWIVVF